ncbi:hypothetical protein GCM10007940_36010 [Portibacter lacus]|uniref:Choice-of-anchor B family protein n=2 Tax=Portibacter lacus TaxID=1099794 RepID=A0AA37SSY0_9BACT|nr:hypothetical protein GCM10007940_36010 [Portibacter lacus]
MTLLDSWDNSSDYNDVWGYVAPDGKEYGIIGDRATISIIDVSDPLNIVKVSDIIQGENSIWRDYKVFSHYLYSITDNGTNAVNGIVVYDLTDPAAPVRVKDVNSEFGRCHNIYIDEANARIYAVGMPGSTDMCVYDLTTPADPVLLNCYDLDTISDGALGISGGFYIHDIFVKDNIAYSSHGYAGYGVWDMNDVDNVSLLGLLDNSFFDAGYVHSSWNSDDDNHAVLATEVGGDPKIYWVDQSDLSNINVLYKYKDPLCNDPGNLANKRPHNPYIIGDKIYTSFYHDGVHVLEIDFEADTLRRVGYYDTYPDNTNYNVGFQGSWGAYPYLPSGIILGSDITYGLFTLTYDGLPTYTFQGPGTDWGTASNWYNDKIPPIGFTGSVVISKNCVKSDNSSFPINAKIIVNTGATFTQE